MNLESAYQLGRAKMLTTPSRGGRGCTAGAIKEMAKRHWLEMSGASMYSRRE